MTSEGKRCTECEQDVHPSNESFDLDENQSALNKVETFMAAPTIAGYQIEINHSEPMDIEKTTNSISQMKVSDVDLSKQDIENIGANATPQSWSVEQVNQWLLFIGLEKFGPNFIQNEIDGSLIMSDDLDDGMTKELIPVIKYRVMFNNKREELKSRQQQGSAVPSVSINDTEILSSENQNRSLTTNGTQNKNKKSCNSLPIGRTNGKATCLIQNGNASNGNNQIDLHTLLQHDKCIDSTEIHAQYFDVDDYELLKIWSLCSSPSDSVKQAVRFDRAFNTLVDDGLDVQTLIKQLIQNRSLKIYVIDSLKRYHSLMDIIQILSSFNKSQYHNYQHSHHKKTIENFLRIKDTITKSVLLTTTIESMSYESQRHLANLIKKNDLPIPFTYYMWNKEKDCLEYRINFNLLAETMCLTSSPYILQIGSQSTIGMGKTSMLQFIFPDKRVEALNTDGNSSLRNGCIDVIFPSNTVNQKNESYVMFDVHGTINTFNEDIITSVQEHCALQILYVTEEDLQSTFLNSMMNYSTNIQAKPTIIVIFDPKYDDEHHQSETLINDFQLQYDNWKNVRWITAPSTSVWYQHDNNKRIKDLSRSQRLFQSFNELLENMNQEIQEQIHCTSIFSIQSYYLTVKTSANVSPPANGSFPIQNQLKELFDHLNDETDNLRIVTPISYFDSQINQCEKELVENWNGPQTEIQTRKDNLIQQRSTVTSMNSYTTFFIDLLTKCSYIELLITEKYLEKWRSKFEPTLLSDLTEAKNQALQLSSEIKQLEERLASEKYFSSSDKTELEQKLNDIKNKSNQQNELVLNINIKLMNVDLTIGLFFDEIMALYEFSPHVFPSENVIENIGKTLINLMLKGFAIHLLRGRPLHCHSQLIKESLKYIRTTAKPPLVLTVIGEQSSAKSSLMNTTFGCNFRVSSGRCTIGIYMSIIHWKEETIVIFDTEGLLSLEEAGSIFDNQMVTMAMLSSHLVLINHKGEFSSNLKDLIGMSFYAKLQIRSPIKPKLLFVLRDQQDLQSKTTFFRQLTQLKTQLQNDSKFLKASIDDEIDIHHENVYLLPNAFSYDKHPLLNISQCWRNQTFPEEIIQLRNVIFKNITNNTYKQKFQLSKKSSTTTTVNNRQISPVEPAYTDMTHLYRKISSNWKGIDRLGPKLLECRSLYEVSIMEELQTIANDIIQNINRNIYNDGEDLIDQIILNSRNHFIDIDHHRIINEFHHQLSHTIDRAINQAQTSFNDKTERSCYLPEMKSKVKKRLELPIRSAQHLLKDIFEERLNDQLKRAHVDDAQKQLLNSVQKELDQNKSLQLDDLTNRLEEKFKSIMKQQQNYLQSTFQTETLIIEKILKIYNSELTCRQGQRTQDNIHKLLHHITNEGQYNEYIRKIDNCLAQIPRQATNQKQTKSGGNIVWRTFTSLFTRSSDKCVDPEWIQLKDKLGWFIDNGKEEKNKKVFLEIWENVLQKFLNDLSSLINNTKSLSSNPNTIQHFFHLIENAICSQSVINNSHRLEKHVLCSDLAVIGLRIIINEAIDKEKSDYELKLQNLTNEIKECKQNLLKQCTAMKDSFELGQTLANTIGKQIMDEVIKLLQRRIIKEIREEIFRSQFINHESIQKQAYEESFSQANGENILKYVYDINRYFIELSLREIKTTVHAVTHKHTLDLQHLLISAINKANDFVQQSTYANTGELKDGIHDAILSLPDLKVSESANAELYSMFSLNNIVDIPINDKERFKQGFAHIRDYYKDIENEVEDSTRCMKIEAFKSSQDSIKQKLGCQAQCPGCGAKCSKPELHDEEEVEVWQEPCKKCPSNKCTCKRPNPRSIQTHEATHHLAQAFFGGRYHQVHTPCLRLCYQNWTTAGKWIPKQHQSNNSQQARNDENMFELIYPSAKFYSEYHPAWYNDLKRQSTEGAACKEDIPPLDQRRAWMVVRHTLVNRYKSTMVDNKEYDKKLYPMDIRSLPAYFKPKWKDEDFE